MLPISLLLLSTLLALLPDTNGQGCQASHNRIVVGGVCVCMDGFYDSGAQNCPACNALCATCVTTATTCTGCSSALHLTLSGTTCICMDGYVMVLGVCQPCHYSCKTCSGLLSTNCITCDTAVRQLTGGSRCICLNGTYDNTTLQSCQPCNAKCLWCSASTSNDCTNCDSNLMRAIGTSNPGPCLCTNGYYDTSTPLCPQCSYTCQTCTISSTTCLSCDPLTHRTLSGTSCSCIAHYYNTNIAICSLCSPRCGNCSISASTCLTCNNTLRVLTGTNCPCVSGYYEDSVTIVCLACTAYCLTCENSSSTCLSCYGYGNRALYNATCACVVGYYDNGTIMCQPCPYYCLTCTGPDPPTCTSCSNTAHRTLSAGSCPCDTGYYDNGSTICQPCYYSCQTCSSSSIMCTSCNSTAHRSQIATDCNCTLGYYDNNLTQQCPICHYSCISCFGPSPNNCYTCQPNRNYTSYSCPCNPGMYELAPLCYTCDPACSTCITNATYCTSCPISRMLVNGSCVCAVGYYVVGAGCVVCDVECWSCDVSASNCTACVSAHNTVLYSGSCICADGYYKNSSTHICQPCHYSCLTCLSTPSLTDCQTCSPSNNRILSITSCPCLPGFYNPGTPSCLACNSHCTTCVGPSDYNCTACASGYVLIGSYCRLGVTCLDYLYQGACVVVCPEGSYGVASGLGNVCLPCVNNCRTCSTATYCLTCIAETYLDSTHSCISYCTVGYYLDTSDGCSRCPTNCLACALGAAGVACTRCAAGYMIQDGGTCVSGCGAGFVMVGGFCHRCSGYCLTCVSLAYNGCVSCQPGTYMLAGVCYKVCPAGYTPNSTLCSPCQPPCQTCLSNTCLSCSPTHYLSPSLQCLPIGYFLNPQGQLTLCHPNCKSCTDTSFSSCLMCASHRGDNGEMAVSGYCECRQGSVDTGDGGCDVNVYEGYRRANQVLVGGTQAMLYLDVLVAVVAGNFGPVVGFVGYLQVYSQLYYLNSSSVMQTDKILQSYRNIHPITFYRSISTQPSISSRLLMTTQTDQSLFLRGQPWQYVSEWAFPAMLLTLLVWAIGLLLLFCQCCCRTKSNKVINSNSDEQKAKASQAQPRVCSFKAVKQSFSTFINYFKYKYLESVPIVLFLLTYPEISLYAAFSFKSLLTMQEKIEGFQLDLLQLVLSVILSAYYLGYLVRMLVGACRYAGLEEKQKDGSPLRILFHQFGKQIKSKLSKAFIPILLARNILLSILIAILAYNPSYQIFSSLAILSISMLINLCICPYRGALRVYFHLTQLLLVIQVSILTYITALPEKSRIGPSQALIIVNYLQLGLILGVLGWIIGSLIVGKVCARDKAKVKEKGKRKGKGKKDDGKGENLVAHEESLANLQVEKEQGFTFEEQKNYLDAFDNKVTVKPDISPYQSSKTQKQEPPQTQNQTRSENKVTKKYRIKRKQ